MGFQPGLSSSWWSQIGLTSAIETQANGGAGVTIALVDTGVAASNPEIAGRVSSASSCAAVTFTCSNGFADDNGHGTATASIAAGQVSASALMSGVAPAATVLSEKVLNAQGSGFDTDVANGIMQAANAGAPVISLSLTYIPTQAVINAINYAVGTGAVIIWAGGNSSAPLNGGANTTGLSDAVLSHIIFVGSVNSRNTLSSFSNTPGSGSAVGSTSSASYASLWLMAPGENIIAPGIQFGPNAYAFWTGTSMSTPEVAGAVALLEATWPILRTNGTATQVLFASATSLGAASTYGDGLLNITKAFQPIGQMSVVTAAGGFAPLASGGGVASSRALGAMPFLRAQLSHYTAFDSFERNFTMNLSGLVASPTRSGQAAQASIAPPLRTDVAVNSAGEFLMIGPASGLALMSDRSGPGEWRWSTSGGMQPPPAYVAFAGHDGSFVAFGRGVSSELSFAQAAWGADSLNARQADDLGVANAFLSLAQGGASATAGASPLKGLRIAAAWSETPPVDPAMASDSTHSDAEVGAVAVTAQLRRGWTAGVTYASLKEDNALLGANYGAAGLIDLGQRRRSRLLGFSTALDLGGHRALMGELSFGQTDGADVASGLIRSVAPLESRAWGVSFVQGDFVRRGDDLTVSVRQPLTVVSGSAQMAVTGVDSFGFPVTSFTPVSLAPDARETDVILGYAAPTGTRMSVRGSVAYRSDADNVAGLNDVSFRLGLTAAF